MKPRHRLLLLAVIIVASIPVIAVVAPRVWEYVNVETRSGRSPGLRMPGLEIPGRDCRYTVKRWGKLAGKPHGKVLSWHENGLLAGRAFNVRGKNHGIATRWNDRGEVIWQTKYFHGDGIESRYAAPWFTEPVQQWVLPMHNLL